MMLLRVLRDATCVCVRNIVIRVGHTSCRRRSPWSVSGVVQSSPARCPLWSMFDVKREDAVVKLKWQNPNHNNYAWQPSGNANNNETTLVVGLSACRAVGVSICRSFSGLFALRWLPVLLNLFGSSFRQFLNDAWLIFVGDYNMS